MGLVIYLIFMVRWEVEIRELLESYSVNWFGVYSVIELRLFRKLGRRKELIFKFWVLYMCYSICGCMWVDVIFFLNDMEIMCKKWEVFFFLLLNCEIVWLLRYNKEFLL